MRKKVMYISFLKYTQIYILIAKLAATGSLTYFPIIKVIPKHGFRASKSSTGKSNYLLRWLTHPSVYYLIYIHYIQLQTLWLDFDPNWLSLPICMILQTERFEVEHEGDPNTLIKYI